MFTIDKIQQNLIEIKKSKFITWIFPVGNVEEINEHLNNLNKEHRDATHICYAYVLSNPNLEKACDNGEPDGTAGKPILDVIKKNNLTNVLIVVIRYFGGIKLGAGGLVRAYSGSSSEVLKLCKIGQIKIMTTYDAVCEISYAKSLIDIIRKNGIKVINQEYSDKFKVSFVAENVEFLSNVNFDLNISEKEKSRVFYD